MYVYGVIQWRIRELGRAVSQLTSARFAPTMRFAFRSASRESLGAPWPLVALWLASIRC